VSGVQLQLDMEKKNKIKVLRELHFPHSVGLLYSCFTYFLGFKVNSGEYKLMGLAPYGNHDDQQTIKFIKLIKDKLVKINDDGSIWLDQEYYNYATGLKMIKSDKWEKTFDLSLRNPEDEINQSHCNLALAIQKITEEIVIKMAREAKRLTGSKNLCIAGGVALNCVANGKLLKENIFEQIYIQPAAGDAGGSLGAALAANYLFYNQNRNVKVKDSMKGTYLGPSFSEKEVQSMNKKTKAVFSKYENFNQLTKDIAEKISKGNVVGWFQGRMEFGPRALGCRSILADARNPEMQKKLNLKIKYREGFRPFAPSVLSESSKDFFDLEVESPYMLFVSDILEKRKEGLSNDLQTKNLWDKLYTKKSDIPSITHVDYSARVQTVHKETNPEYWSLINEFNKLTGYGLVINTSFNVRGEPIVCTPLDAFTCFISTEMDYLVINNFVYEKPLQVDFENKEKWRVKFQMD
jgi:carbamoyltransferase